MHNSALYCIIHQILEVPVSVFSIVLHNVSSIHLILHTYSQIQELNNSQQRNSTRQRVSDVMCLVYWKREKSMSIPPSQRRDVCLSCGESFEYPVESGGTCTTKIEWPKSTSARTRENNSQSTVSDTCL